MEKSYKKPLAVSLLRLGAILIGIALFVVWVDPYQQYHASEHYIGKMRQEIGGVARTHDYDAVITGSSMAMNHYPAQADSLWGWKTKNMSMMGAAWDDYATVLPHIIRQGKVKHIVLSLDLFSFAITRNSVDPALYDENVWNDYRYLWNFTSLQNAFLMLLHPVKEDVLYHFQSELSRGALTADYRAQAAMDGQIDRLADISLAEMKHRFNTTVGSIVRNEGKNIEWLIYFPPYSVAEFILWDKADRLDAFLDLKEYMGRDLVALPNVALYDFQSDPWITDLDAYMDVHHHSHEYNRMILKSLKENKNRIVTPRSLHIDALRVFVREYRDSL